MPAVAQDPRIAYGIDGSARLMVSEVFKDWQGKPAIPAAAAASEQLGPTHVI